MREEHPVVGVVSDRRMVGPHPFHMVGEKYLQAVWDGAGAYPVSLPSLAGDFDVPAILHRLDGLLLTGSPSNIEPRHYLGDPSEPGTWHDPERDIASLALIPAAIALLLVSAGSPASAEATSHSASVGSRAPAHSA